MDKNFRSGLTLSARTRFDGAAGFFLSGRLWDGGETYSEKRTPTGSKTPVSRRRGQAKRDETIPNAVRHGEHEEKVSTRV